MSPVKTTGSGSGSSGAVSLKALRDKLDDDTLDLSLILDSTDGFNVKNVDAVVAAYMGGAGAAPRWGQICDYLCYSSTRSCTC